MGVEALDGALASGSVLCSEAQEGKHGQAAILDLLLLVVLVLLGRATGQTEGVEEAATCTRAYSIRTGTCKPNAVCTLYTASNTDVLHSAYPSTTDAAGQHLKVHKQLVTGPPAWCTLSLPG